MNSATTFSRRPQTPVAVSAHGALPRAYFLARFKFHNFLFRVSIIVQAIHLLLSFNNLRYLRSMPRQFAVVVGRDCHVIRITAEMWKGTRLESNDCTVCSLYEKGDKVVLWSNQLPVMIPCLVVGIMSTFVTFDMSIKLMSREEIGLHKLLTV